VRFDRLRSFKVIDFRTNQKPILVINCNLSPITHRLRDTALQSSQQTPKFEHLIEGIPFKFRRRTYQVKREYVLLRFGENCVILSSVVLSQYTGVTDDRQTTDDTL